MAVGTLRWGKCPPTSGKKIMQSLSTTKKIKRITSTGLARGADDQKGELGETKTRDASVAEKGNPAGSVPAVGRNM